MPQAIVASLTNYLSFLNWLGFPHSIRHCLQGDHLQGDRPLQLASNVWLTIVRLHAASVLGEGGQVAAEMLCID